MVSSKDKQDVRYQEGRFTIQLALRLNGGFGSKAATRSLESWSAAVGSIADGHDDPSAAA